MDDLKKNLKDAVLSAIKKDGVRMRPRWHFVLLAFLTATGALIVLLTLIYITSLGVFAGPGTSTPLKTGDRVEPGMTITTDDTGTATIQFPSGSVAHIDRNTTIRLEAQFFDDESGTSQTSLFLTIGRVWSRVRAPAR